MKLLPHPLRVLSLYIVVCTGLFMNQAALANDEAARPPITGGVPFFYYQDLKTAAEWYEKKLGLKKTAEKDWVVVFELTPSSYIGLVNASKGTLAPTENKGVLLSIETEALEAWYEYLQDVPGINITQGIEEGAYGMIEEFRMQDPGGYIVEFFRWKLTPEERLDSAKGNR